MADFETDAKARADIVAQAAVKIAQAAVEQAAQQWQRTEAPKVYEKAFAAHMRAEQIARDSETVNARMDELFARKAAGTLRPEDIAYAKRVLEEDRITTKEIE